MVCNYKESHSVFCSGELELKAGVAIAVFHLHPSICLTSITCKSASAFLLLDYYSMYNLEGWSYSDKA